MLTTMNEKPLAASALLVQNGASLVSVGVRSANCKEVSVWPAVRRLVLATAQC